jgi:small nuclear ribonucleoprotein (snRNP)-like protein
MSKKILSMALACLLVYLFVCVKPVSASQAQPSNQQPSKADQQAERIKIKVQNLGISTRVTVILKTGRELYGSVAAIDDDSFQTLEVDQKQLVTIAYKDVKNIRFDYGNPNPFNGKRWNPKWGRIAVMGLFAFLVVIIPLTIPRT